MCWIGNEKSQCAAFFPGEGQCWDNAIEGSRFCEPHKERNMNSKERIEDHPIQMPTRDVSFLIGDEVHGRVPVKVEANDGTALNPQYNMFGPEIGGLSRAETLSESGAFNKDLDLSERVEILERTLEALKDTHFNHSHKCLVKHGLNTVMELPIGTPIPHDAEMRLER